jgi:putative MFS transporter
MIGAGMAIPLPPARRDRWAFLAGCAAVTGGVLLHLPMFLMSAGMGYREVGMPMDAGMMWGMLLIVLGVLLAGYGLYPKSAPGHRPAPAEDVAPPEDAALGLAHAGLMVVLTVALVIDVMKPASLGFVVPGMIAEYGIPKSTAAWLPFAALVGTVAGSLIWGVLADRYGRKATILLSAIMFIGTSICGAMPDLWWNVGMCLMMGAAAGGMLPVTYTLLAEIMPSRHRGWALVLVGGLGSVGGYLLASGLSSVLQPTYGWRIMWFLNLPTGLLLVALSGLIPESVKFLQMWGRDAEARQVMQRFSRGTRFGAASARAQTSPVRPASSRRIAAVALSLTGLAWGLVNFGVLLWLPNDLVSQGYSMALSSRLLALSALIALPTVVVAALLYSLWSSKWALIGSSAVTALGLVALLRLQAGGEAHASPVFAVSLLIIGANGVIAVLLPYSTEIFPVRVRARWTGWIAGCTKLGGLVAQALSLLAMPPSLTMAAMGVISILAFAMLLTFLFGQDTRGADLRELEGGFA